jgi:hypothetical protein
MPEQLRRRKCDVKPRRIARKLGSATSVLGIEADCQRASVAYWISYSDCALPVRNRLSDDCLAISGNHGTIYGNIGILFTRLGCLGPTTAALDPRYPLVTLWRIVLHFGTVVCDVMPRNKEQQCHEMRVPDLVPGGVEMARAPILGGPR